MTSLMFLVELSVGLAAPVCAKGATLKGIVYASSSCQGIVLLHLVCATAPTTARWSHALGATSATATTAAICRPVRELLQPVLRTLGAGFHQCCWRSDV